MKVKNKNFIFALILSLILSVGTVVASDNMTFDQSDLKENVIVDENEINGWTDDINSDYDVDDSKIRFELNTTGIVMSDDDYSCGAASFATVLNNLGINMTLDEAKNAVNTNTNGTAMVGIINGAIKYNLSAYALNINTNNLKENYIIHMNIIGVDPWSVVKSVTTESIILADPNLGNYKYDLLEFNQYYTNHSVIITKNNISGIVNDIIPIESNFISEIGQKYISGKGYDYYISKTLGYVNEKPKGPVIRYTIIVPKWGDKTIKLSTTKLTKHKISTKVVYTIKVYSKKNFKGKVETLYQPVFFNFAHNQDIIIL